MIPTWLHVLAIASLAGCSFIAIVIAEHVSHHRQDTAIMNAVRPISALYGGVFALLLYARFGRAHGKVPFPASVAIGTAHCGAGCTLGDMFAESLAVFFPGVVLWFGGHDLFADKMLAVWVLDFVCAFALGIVFQYFAIAPMRNLSLGAGLIAALQADTLSLTAWQVGMYGFMAIAQFTIFASWLSQILEPTTVEFWFVMQIAMLAGFLTSYPVNWWLIKTGIKERM
jgi:hypothetical protein